jgi:GntR family transcriptional regulator
MLTWLKRQSKGEQAFGAAVREVLGASVWLARQRGHNFVGTEHVLQALLARGDGAVTAALESLGVGGAELATRLDGAMGRGGETVRSGPLPYTSRVLRALQIAQAAAGDLNASQVDTEHLLLGILQEGKGLAAQVLSGMGATPAALLEILRRDAPVTIGPQGSASVSARWRPRTTPPAPGRGVAAVTVPRSAAAGLGGAGASDGQALSPAAAAPRITIDDGSARSIYEQIITQFQEAVATGRLRTGERLPTVRRLADELDIAPGTVARAYRELERLGILVTDGARGTRVASRQGTAVSAEARPEALLELMRKVVVAGFHLGAAPAELRGALDAAMNGIFEEPADEA